jgi:hypothetical protein
VKQNLLFTCPCIEVAESGVFFLDKKFGLSDLHVELQLENKNDSPVHLLQIEN